MKKWQRITLTAALVATTAGGAVAASAAANATPATTSRAGQATAPGRRLVSPH